ncbi:neprilysin-1-like [Phymastichus coffea]|uniref:neprilysin-1-like n=1 Tax=Phymastichus coffea TaxID=108790 RepID=UPI00273B2F84|nr:neprilysin-1-like [Phymastichus coffea]
MISVPSDTGAPVRLPVPQPLQRPLSATTMLRLGVLLLAVRLAEAATSTLGDHRDAGARDYAAYATYDSYTNTCNKARCEDVAELFLRSLKKTPGACDDFYAHACGAKRTNVRALTKEIQEILEKPIELEDGRALSAEKRLYRSCVRQKDGEQRTRHEFGRLLRLSNGAALFRESARFGRKSWLGIDGFYASFGFEHAFFNVHVTRDPQRSDVNVISLMPPSPLFFYSVHGLLKYKNFSGILASLDIDAEGARVTDYGDVVDLNNALHAILPPLGMFEENTTTLIDNRMTIDEWQHVYDAYSQGCSAEGNRNYIYWPKVLNVLLGTADVRARGRDAIVIKKTDYFAQLARILERTPPATVEKYIHFKFLAQIGKYLGPSLAPYFENVADRSSFCIKQSDNQLIGATYEYIKLHVPELHKLYTKDVVDNVRKALVDLLANAKWMDKETRTTAASKLSNLDMTVGYPYWQTNKTFVDHYYGNLHLHANFFDNVVKYRRRLLVNELRGLRHPQTYDPTTMSRKLTPPIYHFEVNGHANRIVIPTEYLNEDKYRLFSRKLPSAVNYGSFGSMLGSVLYDYVSLTDSLKFNKFYTRSTDGLSQDTIDAYKVKEKCLSSQLINYKKSAAKADQPLTSLIDLDTIQVDKIYEKMAGLRAAFEAYKKFERDDEKLPGFERMTGRQLFFLSYAERICEIGDIYDRYDVYEPSLKVNGVVSNLEAFSEVFDCPRHSDMNRDVKCDLFS